MNAHTPLPIETLTPVEADGIASVLRMIADALTLTASQPGYRPLVKRRIDDTVQQLIEVSDWLSGDADLEPDNDDEPSLGWASDRGPTAWDSTDDREQDVGDEAEARDPDFEQTARDTFGRGFPNDPMRDDAEDSHDREARGRPAGGAGA